MATTPDSGRGAPGWNWNLVVPEVSRRWRRVRRDFERRVTWSRWYRTTSYARSALWIVPLVAIVLVLIVGPIIRALDASLQWQLTSLSVRGAEALYQTVITFNLSFLVFTFGSLLVAIQIAGGQLTPRIIATTLLRDNVVRYTVGLLVFTLMLSVTSLTRDSLRKEARRARGTVELVPQVGDFVATGEPLFILYGGATAIDDLQLHSAVALGPERTIEQDPMFGFRILVDIGLKALSPAINDPTTAVLALDQLQRLLRVVGRRRLRASSLADGLGNPRVIYHTPNWEDFVHVACTEIRACGAANVQIARRLRAMLLNLATALPAQRQAAIEEELRKLDQALVPLYPIPEGLALAGLPDSQGLGGSTRTAAAADLPYA